LAEQNIEGESEPNVKILEFITEGLPSLYGYAREYAPRLLRSLISKYLGGENMHDTFEDGLSRYILPGIVVLGGAGAAYPVWFQWFAWEKPNPWHLVILAVIGTVAGKTWFTFHKYGVYQLIDMIFYVAARKGTLGKVVNYVEELARAVVGARKLRIEGKEGMYGSSLRERSIPNYVRRRLSGIHLMYIGSEVSVVFSFFNASGSFFNKHALIMGVVGGVGLLFAFWQNLITLRIEQRSEENFQTESDRKANH